MFVQLINFPNALFDDTTTLIELFDCLLLVEHLTISSGAIQKYRHIAPNEDISYWACNQGYVVTQEEYSNIRLEHLMDLEIDNFANFKVELEFVNLMLAKSPVLKKVKIFLLDNVTKDEEMTYCDCVEAAKVVPPKSLTLDIHHGGCFTPIPNRSYIGAHVLSFNVDDIDEFCLHDLKDMIVKVGYGLADLMYYYFLIPRLGLDFGLHPLNVDVDVLEMAKYVKNYKIILVYVEHGSSIFVTPKKGVAITVDNHLRKAPIEIDSSPDVNRNLTPMFEGVDDPFEDLDEILGDYANTGNQITRDEITRKQMVVHVGNSSTVNDVLDLQMLFEIEGVGPIGKFKEVEDSDYDPKHDEVFDDDEHIEDDLDIIDYDSFGSDLDDGIDSERRIQLRELRRIGKQKNKGPKERVTGREELGCIQLKLGYLPTSQQFASKERVTGRVWMHSVETRRKLIMVKNDKERVRVRCQGTIPALVHYVATQTDMGKNEILQTKGGLVIRDNNISGKHNILGKDKTC
ncbi:hypothetical protein Tco_0370346 [Tanacetum coccineum]